MHARFASRLMNDLYLKGNVKRYTLPVLLRLNRKTITAKVVPLSGTTFLLTFTFSLYGNRLYFLTFANINHEQKE